MKKELSQARYDLEWGLLSFRMSRTSFLLSIERLSEAALAYVIIVLGTMLCQLKNWLVFQWVHSMWRPTGGKSDRTSSGSCTKRGT